MAGLVATCMVWLITWLMAFPNLKESLNKDVPFVDYSWAMRMFDRRCCYQILLQLLSSFISLSHLDMNQTGMPVAVKQILLKNIPGKLTNIRQKEITILKVCCVHNPFPPSLLLLLPLSVCLRALLATG